MEEEEAKTEMNLTTKYCHKKRRRRSMAIQKEVSCLFLPRKKRRRKMTKMRLLAGTGQSLPHRLLNRRRIRPGCHIQVRGIWEEEEEGEDIQEEEWYDI